MKKIHLTLGFLIFGELANAQGLPKAWQGIWRGDCHNLRPGSNADDEARPFQLELQIGPHSTPNTLTWTMIYTENGTKQRRPYLLKTMDAAKGRFAVDEGQGTLLDTFLVGNVLMSHFEFPGSTQLTTRDELIGDTIVSDIYSYATRDLRKIGSASNPSITTHQLTSLQRCRLNRN
ncbi:MAG: hypothetical protein M3Q07_23475 [Pseudobdellovibrionaceae bacterium]|nr:hypothetical protein [Pseudobdellovibrionaceae bacterium]